VFQIAPPIDRLANSLSATLACDGGDVSLTLRMAALSSGTPTVSGRLCSDSRVCGVRADERVTKSRERDKRETATTAN